MQNAISIDLEDWFCVHNLSGSIRRQQWDDCELRVATSTRRILDLLREHKVRATFFVLGWVAERIPELILELESQGHEVAVHGYNHLLLTQISASEFEADLAKALEVIERSGVRTRPLGFRAPSFTMVKSTKSWALPILEKHGFRYDSSVFPVGFHPDYGMVDAPLGPYKITSTLYEFPMSCLEVFGKRLPFSGGGYFRQFPYSYTKYCMKRVNREGRPAVFYLHPWEFDPEQPRVGNLSLSQRLRHYRNIDKTERRFAKLLDDFEFTTIREVLGL